MRLRGASSAYLREGWGSGGHKGRVHNIFCCVVRYDNLAPAPEPMKIPDDDGLASVIAQVADADKADGRSLVVNAARDDERMNRDSRRRLADYGWAYHEITTDGAYWVFGIDLDGDGDVDALSASFGDDTIAWYENLDGSGGSWSYHEIYTAADGALAVFGIDLDGDGDVDALSASWYDATIAWYENLDGSGGSWSYHEISTAADGPREVFAIDVDGDGDVDVLSAT